VKAPRPRKVAEPNQYKYKVWGEHRREFRNVQWEEERDWGLGEEGCTDYATGCAVFELGLGAVLFEGLLEGRCKGVGGGHLLYHFRYHPLA
jgi:hypothetical protein